MTSKPAAWGVAQCGDQLADYFHIIIVYPVRSGTTAILINNQSPSPFILHTSKREGFALPPVVTTGTVLSNESEGPGCFRIRIEAPSITAAAIPGQFVNIRTSSEYLPLLRRPFSFCDIDRSSGAMSILLQVVGPGTLHLSELRAGAPLSLVGPLGNGFSFQPPSPISIFCAGGIGVAPFPALAAALHGQTRLSMILGARTADLCLCRRQFAAYGIPVRVATEDGSAGTRGFVTEPLREAMEMSEITQTTVYACGPQPMLAAVAELCRQYRCAAQLSVEAVMGCGVGACLSCVFRTPEGRYVRSCVEGPVFRPGEILF